MCFTLTRLLSFFFCLFSVSFSCSFVWLVVVVTRHRLVIFNWRRKQWQKIFIVILFVSVHFSRTGHSMYLRKISHCSIFWEANFLLDCRLLLFQRRMCVCVSSKWRCVSKRQTKLAFTQYLTANKRIMCTFSSVHPCLKCLEDEDENVKRPKNKISSFFFIQNDFQFRLVFFSFLCFYDRLFRRSSFCTKCARVFRCRKNINNRSRDLFSWFFVRPSSSSLEKRIMAIVCAMCSVWTMFVLLVAFVTTVEASKKGRIELFWLIDHCVFSLHWFFATAACVANCVWVCRWHFSFSAHRKSSLVKD